MKKVCNIENCDVVVYNGVSSCKLCHLGRKEKTEKVKKVLCKKLNKIYYDNDLNLRVKYCSVCKQYLYETEFAKNKKTISQLGTYCKECANYLRNKLVSPYRIIIEEKLCRKLNLKEVIHHRDRNHSNNRLENLLLTSHSNHMKLHKGRINNRIKREIF